MKKILLVCVALLVIACLVTVITITKGEPNSPGSQSSHSSQISDLPSQSTQDSPPNDSTKPETDSLSIKQLTYTQDPESGDYILTNETTHSLRKGAAFSITPTAPEHYTIDTERSRLSLESCSEQDELFVYYACESCTVSFFGGKDSSLTNGEATQILRKGQVPTSPSFSRYGYTLTGFDKPLAPVYEDTTYTAEWTLTYYTLTLYATEDTVIGDESFVQRSDAKHCFEKPFTVFDSFVLPVPQSENYTFRLWNSAADSSGNALTEISKDTARDVVLYAIYDVTLYEIEFGEVEGTVYPSYYLPQGERITAPYIAPADQKAGCGLNWYEDEACTRLYAFTVMPKDNIKLYGKWELDTGTGFLAWNLEDFSSETIDSYEELLAFIDYIQFYDLTEAVEIEVTYATYQKVMEDVSRSGTLGDFRASGAIGYGAGEKTAYRHENAKCYLSIHVTTSYRDKEATLTTEPSDEKALTYLAEKTVGRGESYRDFYIESLPDSFIVSSTNQLQYVVEHGYRPLPKAGSPAERIYNAAKRVLNEILPQDATDFEKVEAIFNYLVLNIQYDNAAVEVAEKDETLWPHYDAFFMEGVFDNKKAVCDGIAKAFSLLCNMEGIPCVEVIGARHAWNRVKIDNIWYVADATHGNLHIRNMNCSLMDHTHFLISDSEKTALGYSSESYPNIKASAHYDYFTNKTFTLDGKTYDYVIDSVEELAALLEYLLTLKQDLTDCSIDFVYSIRFTSLASAYPRAADILKRKGIRLDNDCISVDPNNAIMKLIFTT